MTDHYREIDPRDWRVRVVALAAVGLLLALLWALGLAVRDHGATLKAVAATDPGDAARRAGFFLRRMIALLAAGNVVVAAYLSWVGARVVASGKLPPPGSWIVKGRRIYEGRLARRIGQSFVVLAVVIVAASAGMVWLGWRLTAG
jgi:hypothetical protein